jgi:hypothetical protein
LAAGKFVRGPVPGYPGVSEGRCVFTASFALTGHSSTYQVALAGQAKTVVDDIGHFALSVGAPGS